jgi:hypothetical protein
VKHKKRDFIPYSFHIGYYIVKDTTHAKKEGLRHLEYRFPTCRFRKHGPKYLVPQHAGKVVSYWPYTHDSYEDELFTENAQDWEEVIKKKKNPKITNFKAMSVQEQFEIVEHREKATIRARGEVREVEATESAKRGIMLLDEVERVVKIMRQTPFLQTLEPPRIVPVETDTHATDPNNTKASPPDRIITQDDQSYLQTQVEQLAIARMPQRSSRTPTITGVPPGSYRFNNHI